MIYCGSKDYWLKVACVLISSGRKYSKIIISTAHNNHFKCSFTFFVIAKAKARSNPAQADSKRSEDYNFKLDENGLLLDSKFHITPPLSPLSKRDI